MYIKSNRTSDTQCGELHIGNTPRSIMTKGNSNANGTRYGNFIKGNRDKLMISYRRERTHDYTIDGACGVLFEGEIHFFGVHGKKTRRAVCKEPQFLVHASLFAAVIQRNNEASRAANTNNAWASSNENEIV